METNVTILKKEDVWVVCIVEGLEHSESEFHLRHHAEAFASGQAVRLNTSVTQLDVTRPSKDV